MQDIRPAQAVRRAWVQIPPSPPRSEAPASLCYKGSRGLCFARSWLFGKELAKQNFRALPANNFVLQIRPQTVTARSVRHAVTTYPHRRSTTLCWKCTDPRRSRAVSGISSATTSGGSRPFNLPAAACPKAVDTASGFWLLLSFNEHLATSTCHDIPRLPPFTPGAPGCSALLTAGVKTMDLKSGYHSSENPIPPHMLESASQKLAQKNRSSAGK